MAVYDVGDSVRVTGTFTVASVVTDPTTVTLEVKDPSGNVATYTYALSEVTRSGTGVFYKDLTIDEAGIWTYRWSGTGAVVSAGEEWLEVRRKQTA